jgi:hypothetical protein
MDISRHATLQAAAKMATMHDTAGNGRRQSLRMLLAQAEETVDGGLVLHRRAWRLVAGAQNEGS